jgi:Holliday junction resolvase RusA-like endonuclease
MIEFIVPAIPVAQPRARATSIGGHARVYEPKDHPIAAFKASVRLAASGAFSGAPLQGPLRVDCLFLFPRPKSLLFKKRDMPRVRHVKKPDADNLCKSVLDSLNGLAWLDDCQVCEMVATKWIAAGDEQPHVLVRVTEL